MAQRSPQRPTLLPAPPPSQRLTVWPSTTRGHHMTSTQLPLIRSGANVSGPDFMEALRGTMRSLVHVAASSNAADGESFESGDSRVNSALVRLQCLRDGLTSLRRVFKTYTPLWNDMVEVVDVASVDIENLIGLVERSEHRHQTALQAVADTVKSRTEERNDLERLLEERERELSDLHEKLSLPLIRRRDVERMEAENKKMQTKLDQVVKELQEAQSQLVSKLVTVSHLEAERERGNEIISALRQELDDTRKLYAATQRQGELQRLDAEARYRQCANERDSALHQLHVVSEQLTVARRGLHEREHGGSSSLENTQRNARFQPPNQTLDAGFDWTRLCEAKHIPDLYEVDDSGQLKRHIADMNEAERIRHVVSLWRRYRTQLRLADEFIHLHGLTREVVIAQDVAAVSDPHRDMLDASITPAIVCIRHLAHFQPMVSAPPTHVLTPGIATPNTDAMEVFFLPLSAAKNGSVPSFLASPFGDAPVRGFDITVEDAVAEVRDFFDFLKEYVLSPAAQQAPGTAVQAMELWFVSSKYVFDPSRRLGFAYSLWYVVERELRKPEYPLEFQLLVLLISGTLPSDFLNDFESLVSTVRNAFRTGPLSETPLPVLTRASLTGLLRQVLYWYHHDDLEELLRAADATLPYQNVGVFDEATLFRGDGLFLRTLCLHHMMHVSAHVKGMAAAVDAMVPTPAAAVVASRLLVDGLVAPPAAEPDRPHGLETTTDGTPRGKTRAVRALHTSSQRKGGENIGPPQSGTASNGVVEVQQNIVVARGLSLTHPVVTAAATPMLKFGDVLSELVRLDQQKPLSSHIAFLLRALRWEDMPTAVKPMRTSSLVGDNIQLDSSLLVEESGSHAGWKQLRERWLEKKALVAALSRTTVRRDTPATSWHTLRLSTQAVYRVQTTKPPMPTVEPPLSLSTRRGRGGVALR